MSFQINFYKYRLSSTVPMSIFYSNVYTLSYTVGEYIERVPAIDI